MARIEELRRALNMRDADAVDRWATARVLAEHARVLRDDEVVEITPDEFFGGAF